MPDPIHEIPPEKPKPDLPPTRERIVLAALRLFQEQGFTATGVSTILREAGVNSGSMYHYFDSKEDLLRACLQWYIEHLEPIVMAPQKAATPGDPVERIFTLLDWYRQGLVQMNCTLGCPVGNLALECSDQYPLVRELIDRNFENWAAEIERWLDEAGDRLPGDLDRKSLSKFVLTVMEGGVMQARAHKSIEPFDASVAVLRDYTDRLLVEAAAKKKSRGGSGGGKAR
ncbi:MAG: TetR/AcrR family transcriptional regulator [Phycisphaeraceae bacterium]|nr:TetR/AcrR family transcriptional regulator [Phycisphaeraceae bacterium]MCB9847734.1 TetR/AcrR family transcriptional regulator [Phycisphaeraceae bacterium]